MPTFTHPVVLLLIPALLLGVLLLERRADATPRRRLARVLVRGLVLSLLVAAFAAPQLPGWRPVGRRLVIAVDRSPALDVHGRREALELARAAAEGARREGAAVSLLGFAERAASPYALEAEWPRGPAGPWPEPPAEMGGSPVAEPPTAARALPAAALAAAELAFGPGERGTILLLTSGRGTLTGLETAAHHLEETGLRLRAAALPVEAPPPPPGVAVVALDLPPVARGVFDVTALVRGPGALEVELLVDGRPRGRSHAEPTRDGRSTVSFSGLDLTPGIHEVALVVRGAGAPAALDRRLVVVEPQPRILACLERPETSPVRRALSAQGFTVVAVPSAALPAALAGEGPPPDALILDAVTVQGLPVALQRQVAARVEQGLGLFVEAGSSEEAWTALAEAPLGRLLPVVPVPPPPEPPPPPPTPDPTPPQPPPPSVEPPEEDDTPGLRAERRPDEALPISLMLVLDRSGSMHAGGKLAMAIEGARRAAAALSPNDRVAVVTFADESALDIPPTPVRRLGNLGWRLAMLQPGGNTDIFGALVRATAVLEKEQAPIRHMILLTDGDQNTGGALFSPLMRKMRAAGITLTALGLGHDHNEFLLKRLVQFSARGRYRSVDGAAQLPTILTRDTQRVAEYREREAKAMARLEDPDRLPEPTPTQPEPPPEQPPQPPGPEPSAADPAPPPTEVDRPTLAPLHLLRPHEATRGLDPEALPVVGAPRRSTPRRGAPLLLVRGDGEPVLAARRWGLGRTMAWTLPPDATGVAAWPDLGRVFVQGVRSVRAPKGAFDRSPTGRIVRSPDGERLVLDPAHEGRDPTSGVRVTWTDTTGPRDLGTFVPGQDVALPAAAPGTAAIVRLTPVDGGGPSPPLTYLAGQPPRAMPRAGDVAALAAALGPAALEREGPLLPPPARLPVPTPLWPVLVALAALLLPLDAALHRRTRGGTGTPARTHAAARPRPPARAAQTEAP